MDLSNIKVSVITPTYNDEKYVKETLESILNQTHKNIEVLVVDDCSMDNTVEIIKSFKDERIKLFINEKNSGAAFSRNRAIREAAGDYIAFLDADDLWELDKVEKQLFFMISNNFCFSYTNYYLIDENGIRLQKYITGPRVITHKTFMKMDYVGCLTAMYKRSIYPNLQIPNDIYKRNDYALWLKLSEKTNCYLLNLKLASYRKRNGSISSGKKSKLFKYHINLYSSLYGYNRFKSALISFRNAFYYFLKQLFYKKNI